MKFKYAMQLRRSRYLEVVIRIVEYMFANTEQQMRQVLEICEFFSLQLSESTDVIDVYQFPVFIPVIFRIAILRRKC